MITRDDIYEKLRYFNEEILEDEDFGTRRLINLSQDIINRWNEPYRFYHNIDHLENLFNLINNLKSFSEDQKIILYITAIFHDIIYDPKRNDNEMASISFFEHIFDKYRDNNFVKEVSNIIKSTAVIGINNKEGLEYQFGVFDCWGLIYGNLDELISNENKIFKEYQWVDYKEYLDKRIEFLKKFKDNTGITQDLIIEEFIKYLKSKRPKIGIFAGSFKPFHIGHLNIVEKISKIFDKVIIVFAKNPDKENLNRNSNYDYIKDKLYYQIEEWDGLITDYISNVEEYADVTYIRGIRNGYDLHYEYNQLQYLKDLKPNINHMMIFCDSEFAHISSTDIRNFMKIDPEKAKKYLI